MATNEKDVYRVPSVYDQCQTHLPLMMSKKAPSVNPTVVHDEFQPLKPYRICPIHIFTPINEIQFLLKKILETTIYSIHTQRIDQTEAVSLIKIELQNVQHSESYILVFEMFLLPRPYTSLFTTIQLLLHAIFLPQKKIFIWNNDTRRHLNIFVHRLYLSPLIFNNLPFIEMEQRFKAWYHRHYKDRLTDLCLCDTCTIELALNQAFQESIEKRNKSTMCCLNTMDRSVSYCLGLTKLSMIVELDWTSKQIYQFKKFHQNVQSNP